MTGLNALPGAAARHSSVVASWADRTRVTVAAAGATVAAVLAVAVAAVLAPAVLAP